MKSGKEKDMSKNDTPLFQKSNQTRFNDVVIQFVLGLIAVVGISICVPLLFDITIIKKLELEPRSGVRISLKDPALIVWIELKVESFAISSFVYLIKHSVIYIISS